ncbi:hypothetical protein Tco_1144258 [Tanacetum coccineum]
MIDIKGSFDWIFVEEEDGSFLGFQLIDKGVEADSRFLVQVLATRKEGSKGLLVFGLPKINGLVNKETTAAGIWAKLETLYMTKSLANHLRLKLEDVLATLNSRELQKMTEAKGDGGEGLYMRGRSDQRDMKYPVQEPIGDSYHMTYKRDYLFDFEEYYDGNVLLGMAGNAVYGGWGFTVKMQSYMIKIIKGPLVVLSGTRRANCVYTLDGHAVTKKTLKGRKQLGEYQIWWKIKTCNVLDSYNQGSTQQCMKSGVAKHLLVAEIQQHYGLVKETNVTLLAKVRCFMIQSAIGFKTPIDLLGFFGWIACIKQMMLKPGKVKCILLGYREDMIGYQLWRLDDVTSKVVLYKNMVFNESGEYKETFIGYGVSTSSVYRDNSIEAAFAVAEVEKIYAHESLTFNDTVVCEVISMWKAGLKEEMDTRSDVLSNNCRKNSDDRNDYYWEYTQVKVYNEKLVQTLLEGHTILSLEGSLSGGCDVEKNEGFYHKLQTNVQGFVYFDYAMCRSITRYGFMIQRCVVRWEAKLQCMGALSATGAAYTTLTKAVKEASWLKGLSTESRTKLRLVAVVTIGALTNVVLSSRFQYWLELLSIHIG